MEQHSKSVIIEQSLHGYQNGHRLLSSSLKLTRTEEREMLALSDLSGRSIRSGYEENITGYPLPEIGKYVVAKTWYASEMPRPGCVWTHSFLIDFTDLAVFPDLQIIQKYFKRPQQYLDLNEYKKPLSIELDINDIDQVSDFEERFVKVVLNAIYNEDQRPVIILSDDSKSYEKLIFSIWAQQWPKLRRSFSFASKSLSARSSQEKLLDLQFVSRSVGPELKNRYKDAILIDSAIEEKSFSIRHIWLDIAWKDLVLPNATNLRTFLKEFGSEHDKGREAFSRLVETYGFLENSKNRDGFQWIYSEIAKIFPSKNHAQHLKKALTIEKNRPKEWLGDKWSIPDVLKVLESPHTRKSFNLPIESIPHLVTESWKNDRVDSFKSFLKIPKNTKERSQFADTIAKFMEPSDMHFLAQLSEKDQQIFLEKKPSLLFTDNFWRENRLASSSIQLAINQLIKNMPSDQVLQLTDQLLRNSSPDILESFVREHFNLFVSVMLNQISAYTHVEQKRIFNNLSIKKILLSDEIVEWLSKNTPTSIPLLIWAIEFIGPFNTNKLKRANEAWLPLVKRKPSNSDSQLSVEILAGLLLLAFTVGGKTGESLALATYPRIIDIVDNGQLSSKIQNELDRALDYKFGVFQLLFSQNLSAKLSENLENNIKKHSWAKIKFKKFLITRKKRNSIKNRSKKSNLENKGALAKNHPKKSSRKN